MIPEKKNIHVMNPEQITEPVNEPQIRGNRIPKMPQPALTPSDGTLANAVIRIGELEAILKKAQWLKTN